MRRAGDAPQLRGRVEALLLAHSDAGDFLGGQSPAGINATIDQPITERPGTVIGRYKLLEQIGEGGFGVVFMAEQEEPVRRKVALKIIKPGMDTKEVIARFEAERQALAMMDHPNIAKVLDAGATESGRPYFVMELVRGIPITEYLRSEQSDHPGAAGAVRRQSARPSSMPTRRGSSIATSSRRTSWSRCTTDKPVPKVIDFGVAKATNQRLTEQTLFTELRADDRHAALHEPRAGGDERAGRRHPQRHLFAGRAAVRTADRHDALRSGSGFDEAAYDEIRRIIREEEPRQAEPDESARLGDTLPSVAAHREVGSQATVGTGPRRAGLDRDEGPGEGPHAPLRDGQRLREQTCSAI